MKNKLTKTFIAVIASTLSIFFFSTSIALADPPECSNPNIPDSVKQSAYHCGSNSGNTVNDAGNAVGNILSIIIGALGIVAVIFVVMGGIQYMTSAGDATKLKRAKDTILYACIGLAICVLSFAITQFAINDINSSTPATNNTSTP